MWLCTCSLALVLFNTISISVFYKDNVKPTTVFLSLTNLPSMYVASDFNKEGKSMQLTTLLVAVLDQPNFFFRLSGFLNFNGRSITLFHRPKGYLLNVLCYPLTSNISINTTNKATMVLLARLSCQRINQKQPKTILHHQLTKFLGH